MNARVRRVSHDQWVAARAFVDNLLRNLPQEEVESSIWTETPMAEPLWDAVTQCLTARNSPLQFGYFARSQAFVHQLSSRYHDTLRHSLVRNIVRKLYRLCRAHGVRTFARRTQVSIAPQSQTESPSSRDSHQPDIYVTHVSPPRSGVAVEITYSGKRDRAQELAEFYLLYSRRQVSLFINIDYDRRRSWKVTLHTWRRDNTDPTGMGLTHRSQEIRDDSGIIIDGAPLRICLLDIASQEHVPPFLHHREIELSVREIGSILEEADFGEALEEDESVEDSSDEEAEDSPDSEDEWPFEKRDTSLAAPA